ncbi:MAG TPA: type II secretion system F family protein [Bryobacteraceae bacterium]|jgi:tight adherence protein C|nr:type II secretion system F family protein [Bryobacteraceae bacterium]
MFLLTVLMFIGLAVAAALTGMKLYLRPKEAMERVVGGIDPAEHVPTHPSLAFHELIKKLGNIVPQSPKDVTVMQRRLIRAGIRGENSLKILYGAKVACAVLLPLLTAVALTSSTTDSGNKFGIVMIAAAVGFFGPNEYVRRVASKRQHEIGRGLPNALDLLVVCVESGLGLDQAILQVSKELEHAHPEISQEFGLVNLELKAGKRRIESLRNLAERSGVDDLKKLVAVLIQADRFGTGVAQSLRAHADFMRVQARQVAEEKAAKLGVKLVFPIFFCILPTLFVVTVGPVIVKIMRELLPMMNNM